MPPFARSERLPARPLNLWRSVILRVALGAVLSFAIATTYAVISSDRAGHRDAEKAAEVVRNNLDLQLWRISVGSDVAARFPDWDFLAGHVLRAGLCLRLLDNEGVIARASCAGSAAPSYPEWFGTLHGAILAPNRVVELPLAPNTVFRGRVAAFLETSALRAGAWEEVGRLLPFIVLTVLCVSALAVDAIRRALRPTEEVLAGLNRLAGGELSYRLPAFRLGELQRISDVANHMASTLEATLAESREFSRRLVTAQEEERQYLARELHDEFGQSLAAINAIAASIQTSVARSFPDLSAEAQTLSDIAMSMMGSLRSTLVRLRPATVDELGLVESLRSLVAGWNARAGNATRFEFVSEGQFDDLEDAVVMSLYRIAQEGLTNAARHAEARRVRLKLARAAVESLERVELTIEDDGRGCDLARTPVDALGLRGIRERVCAFGGRLAIDTAAGKGTALRAMILLDETRQEAV